MKLIRVNHKMDWGVSIKFYTYKNLRKVEYNEKLSSFKLIIDVDVIEGHIEQFDVEKFEGFAKAEDDLMVFEICVG